MNDKEIVRRYLESVRAGEEFAQVLRATKNTATRDTQTFKDALKLLGIDERDLGGIRTYISQRLAPFEQDWNDREVIIRTIRERFPK